MRRLTLAACVVVLWAAPARGQVVTLPAEVRGAVGAWIIIAPEKKEGGEPRWRIDPGLEEVRLDLLLPPETLKQLRGKVVTAAAAGRYKVEAWNAKGDAASDISTCWVIVGEPPPSPKPEPPKPEPPKPEPPKPTTGLKVLIVYETSELSKMPRPQHAVLFSKSVRDYLNAKTVVEPDGKTKSWRIFDRDTDASNDARGWAELLKRPRQSLPWVVLTDGAGAVIHEGPLPVDTEQTLTLLRKWGN